MSLICPPEYGHIIQWKYYGTMFHIVRRPWSNYFVKGALEVLWWWWWWWWWIRIGIGIRARVLEHVAYSDGLFRPSGFFPLKSACLNLDVHTGFFPTMTLSSAALGHRFSSASYVRPRLRLRSVFTESRWRRRHLHMESIEPCVESTVHYTGKPRVISCRSQKTAEGVYLGELMTAGGCTWSEESLWLVGYKRNVRLFCFGLHRRVKAEILSILIPRAIYATTARHICLQAAS